MRAPPSGFPRQRTGGVLPRTDLFTRLGLHYLNRQLSDLDEREDRLYDDLAGGTLDDVAYRRQLQRLRDQRASCTEQLEAANEQLDRTYLADAQKILELAGQAKSLWLSQSDAKRRKFLDAILSNATLTGRTIGFELKKPSAFCPR